MSTPILDETACSCITSAEEYLWAKFEPANLSGTHLRGANLSHANLSKADVSHANLRGANLAQAQVEGANFQEADLREMPWIIILTSITQTDANFADALWDQPEEETR